MGEGEGHTGFWWGDRREIGHFIDLDVDKRVILNWTITKWNGGEWTELILLRIGDRCASSCDCGNDLLDSIKRGEFLELKTC
jgi:hypothetical protein